MTAPRRVFTKVDILPDWAQGHFIQWKLDPFFKAPRPYNFIFETSEVPDFSEILYRKDNLGDTFFAVDNTKLKQSWDTSYYYRITLETADGRKFYSPAVLFGFTRRSARKYAMAAEVIRKELLLCRMAGAEAWLLRRKSYGAVSDTTRQGLDPVTGVPIADEKGKDYGVGLDGGYFSPLPCAFKVQDSNQRKGFDPNGLGVREDIEYKVRMPGYPLIDSHDVICEAQDGYRYSVQDDVQFLTFPGTNIPVAQLLTLRLIPNTDSVYSVKLPIPGPIDQSL
jgi:hypothetical protein